MKIAEAMSGNLSVIACEEELNVIVEEYLQFGGFDGTLAEFERECRVKNKPIGEKRADVFGLELHQKQLMNLFHEGNAADFFVLWQQFVLPAIQEHDQTFQKMVFHLRLYFTVYPIKNNLSQVKRDVAMTDFKEFLGTCESTLSQTAEFLPFYALPFIANPKLHPSYADLFTEKWSINLGSRLKKYLADCLIAISTPRLLDIYMAAGRTDLRSQGDVNIAILRQGKSDAEKKCSNYIYRHNKMQSDYHRLIGITADLVDALESTVQGNAITPYYLQQLCESLFTTRVATATMSIDFSRPGTAGEVLRASIAPQHCDEREQFVSLDYDKLKIELQLVEGNQKALILQALRWRLTRSHGEKRDYVLADYVKSDIFGCREKGSYRDCVGQMFDDRCIVVRQYAARFLNAMASLCGGRSYLSLNEDLIANLMHALPKRGEQHDQMTQEMLLGALQKLSLKRKLQTAMIVGGVVDWLVGMLEDNDSLTDYTLEYSVALLMNLCLRTSGKKRCCINGSQKILQILSDLLGHYNKEIRPYVNGALYSILAIGSIRDEANAMGMDEILRCFIKEGQGDMNRQTEFIIKQLNSDEHMDDSESDDDDDDDDDEEEDQYVLEADLDKDEIVIPMDDGLCGEQLLSVGFSGTVLATHVACLRGHVNATPISVQQLQRPVTPYSLRCQRKSTHTALSSSCEQARQPISPIKESHNMVRLPTSNSSLTTNFYLPSEGGADFKCKYSDLTDHNNSENRPAVIQRNSMLSKSRGQQAFCSQPRIPRTPDLMTNAPFFTRGSLKAAPPKPQYSESEPRPSSGKSGLSI